MVKLKFVGSVTVDDDSLKMVVWDKHPIRDSKATEEILNGSTMMAVLAQPHTYGCPGYDDLQACMSQQQPMAPVTVHE